MQIFVENIEDDILFLTFYCFSRWISIFEVNISHPIILFSFCYINVDSEGLKFSCNKHSNVLFLLLLLLVFKHLLLNLLLIQQISQVLSYITFITHSKLFDGGGGGGINK